MTKLPPIEKVYEAWSAVADGRVQLQGPDSAHVQSSDGQRTYTVEYDPANDTYASNDNATFWRGYPGYPVIAVMMVRGTLPLDYDYCRQWAGVNWTEINSTHKRDYAAAVDQVERERGIDAADATQRAEQVMGILQALPAKVKRLKAPQV